MMNTNFQGAIPVGKPPSMTDEQCSSAWALPHITEIDVPQEDGTLAKVPVRNWLMRYQPSKEDMEAIAKGGPIWLNIMAAGLTPHSVWTVNPDTGEPNF